MPTLLSLTKDKDVALKALSGATTAKARAVAATAFEKATLALAAFNAKLAAKSKGKDDEPKDAPEEEEEEDEESESEEEEDEEEDEDEEDEEDDEEDEEDEEGDDDGDDDDDDDDDEERCQAALTAARAALKSAKASKHASAVTAARASLQAIRALASPSATRKSKELRAQLQSLTGKKSTAAMLGAVQALKETASTTERVNSDVAKIKANQLRDRVDAMLRTARTEGKVTKAESKALREQGLKSPKWLRSYLSVRPKSVRLLSEGPRSGRTADGGRDGDATAPGRPAPFSAESMTPEQRKIVDTLRAPTSTPRQTAQLLRRGHDPAPLGAEDTGLVTTEFNAFVEQMNKRRAAITQS